MPRMMTVLFLLLFPLTASASEVGDASTNNAGPVPGLFKDRRPQTTGQCDNDANTDPNKIHVKVEFVNERTKMKELVEYGEMCRRIKADQDRNEFLKNSTTQAMLTGKQLVIKTDSHGNVTVIANQPMVGGLYGGNLMGVGGALAMAQTDSDVDQLRALLAAQDGQAPALNGGGGRRGGGNRATSNAELAAKTAELELAKKDLASQEKVINELSK